MKMTAMKTNVPNATTIKAMKAADSGKGKRFRSPDALFRDLRILANQPTRNTAR
ncbi:MAG TPA: hypothetical protein VGF88_15710 [Acidobacteriaceae bacterium]|jgi:hypothetical protein